MITLTTGQILRCQLVNFTTVVTITVTLRAVGFFYTDSTPSSSLPPPNTCLFATAAQLLAATSITSDYDNEDVRQMTSLTEPMLERRASPAFTRALVTQASLTEAF